MNPIWIGSPTQILEGPAAEEALKKLNDAQYWSEGCGITKVDRERWKAAQQFEQTTWERLSYASSDRAQEHAFWFDGYKDVKQDLGGVLEVGCGPFTQLATIKENRQISRVVLQDPLVLRYLAHPNCVYKNGRFFDFSTTLRSCLAEDLDYDSEFDTIICINVLEHVMDVEQVFGKMHQALKVGGTLVFSERSWDGFDPLKMYDVGHPVRITSKAVERYLSLYAPLYLRVTDHDLGHCHYFIGTKIDASEQ